MIGYWPTLQRIMTASATEVYAVVPLELKTPFSRGKLDLLAEKTFEAKPDSVVIFCDRRIF